MWRAPKKAGPERDRDPDRAGADDQHRVARLEARFPHRIEAHGQGLDQGALGEAHASGSRNVVAAPTRAYSA